MQSAFRAFGVDLASFQTILYRFGDYSAAGLVMMSSQTLFYLAMVVILCTACVPGFQVMMSRNTFSALSREDVDYDAQLKDLGKFVSDLQNQILYKVDEGLKPKPVTPNEPIQVIIPLFISCC